MHLVHRALRRIRREIHAIIGKARAHHRTTFFCDDRWPTSHAETRLEQRFQHFSIQRISSITGYFALVQQQADQSRSHRFDILGSGAEVVAHGMTCRAIEGTPYLMSQPITTDPSGRWLDDRINDSNLGHAKRIWQLVDEGYIPIDWQLDFKSGYRWDERTWHRSVRFGNLAGVDVKVPWELARMQHLPTLALACHFARAGFAGYAAPVVYAREFRNQALDFIATNPPGFGVNWSCAMDAAIRVANLLIAYDIALASGVQFDDQFEAVFSASVVSHARHVASNLEWSPQYRGNHYLANIAGLLFAATYLPCGEEADAWLAFAVQELLSEVAYQFHEDGSNFEASVCYHRLSAEMLMWSFALLANLAPEKCAVLMQPRRHRSLPRLRAESLAMHPVPGTDRASPVPGWCWSRLARMADFTEALTRPDGQVVQFGDNDSGRFIVLGSGEQLRAGNDPAAPAWSLDHGFLIAGIRALVGVAPTSSSADEPGVDILCSFAGLDRERLPAGEERNLASPAAHTIGDAQAWELAQRRFRETSDRSRWISRFSAPTPGLLDGLESVAFPGMGCYVFRSPRLYLAVRCGEIGLAGLGAHAHCDQLAIELVIDGETRVRDPGTFIYTAFPEKRNAYRSAKAHHVPRVAGREPADLTLGTFDLRGAAEGECLYFGPRGFIGRHAGYGAWVYRIIELGAGEIVVHDFAEGGLPLIDPTPENLPFSPAYGRTLP